MGCSAGQGQRNAVLQPVTNEADSAQSRARGAQRAEKKLKITSAAPLGALARLVEPPPLSSAFHRGRREALRQLLPAHGVAVLFAAPPRLLAADVDYPFHQDPDFYYLTGLREPGAVLLLFADPQPSPAAGGPPITEQLYVRSRDALDEQWNGGRLGPEGAARTLGFGRVLPAADFVRRPPDLTRFARVCFLPLLPGEEGRDTPADSTELTDLHRAFRRAASIPADFNGPREQTYARFRAWGEARPERLVRWLNRFISANPALITDPHLRAWAGETNAKKRAAVLQHVPPPGRPDVFSLENALDELREIKQPEELALLRYAIDATVVGHREALRALAPDKSEADLDGIQQHVFRHYHTRADGYWPIVGAGANGCVLHYIDNNRPQLGAELVVMDVAAAYAGYTADVTRTAPADGAFSAEQCMIYELVLRAQEAGIRECRAGRDFFAPNLAAQKIIGEGLVKLGLISSADSVRRYFPHGTSHYLGLDVHDRGSYGPLRPGAVITVEPGIYIPPHSPCDPKWWGIGCRIEDDILITEQDPENLSVGVPRTSAEIEQLIAEPSGLDGWLK
ncbi:MAG: aminopeptidase P N-terminal domain-containing protein [Hymenobacteraceae bacterium]|nr:aminopeptidase P N-terminal domain-containing protein [Hymenobacteraceae bacterium]